MKRFFVTAMLATAALMAFGPGTVGAEDLEPLKIDLPEAFAGGTPPDYWSKTLEPEQFGERPPFLAPRGTALLSRDKPVSAGASPTVGNLKQITDGVKSYPKRSVVELPAGLQWVQIDLEKEAALYAVVLWHFHEFKRVYFDVIVQVSNDPEFKTGIITLLNNDADNSAGLGAGKDPEYIENHRGRLIKTEGAKVRYVRLYANGNHLDPMSHYIEVEVYGK